jgi:hypothetical protein
MGMRTVIVPTRFRAGWPSVCQAHDRALTDIPQQRFGKIVRCQRTVRFATQSHLAHRFLTSLGVAPALTLQF